MAVPRPKPRNEEPDLDPKERAGPAVPRERASADYENPREDVSDIPEPVALPPDKARQGETRGHMRIVLMVGIALAIAAFIVGYFIAE
jgi:hypothetical protein